MILLDNTALSAFAHIDRLDLPSKLFGEAFIPESVYYEGVLIKVIKPSKHDVKYANKLPATLGPGERYTIAIGISMKCLIATDDLKPRKIAKGLGLDIIGTLGILRTIPTLKSLLISHYSRPVNEIWAHLSLRPRELTYPLPSFNPCRSQVSVSFHQYSIF